MFRPLSIVSLLVSALSLGLLLTLSTCSAEQAAPPPDVVILMLDTARADHLGPFNERSPVPTPFLDALAERSLVFENAWAASTHTSPSTASIFTGLVTLRHGVQTNNYPNLPLVALPKSVTTLAEHLSLAGYQTLGVGSNPNINEERGFHRGFDTYSANNYLHAGELAEKLYELQVDFDPDRPMYTFMHFMDAHIPYNSRQPWCRHGREASKEECPTRCRYRSEIAFLDSQLEKLFDRMGWHEDTIVVVVTDHGEEFGDHGDIMHRYSVHTELARAGLLILIPGVEPVRSDVPAHHIDILPTILRALDLPSPEILDGSPLQPFLAREQEARNAGRRSSRVSDQRPLLTHRSQGDKALFGLTIGPWRLIEEFPNGRVELYHIGEDPREERDLATRRPDMLEKLRARLQGYITALDPIEVEEVSIDFDDEQIEELRRLGYLGDDG